MSHIQRAYNSLIKSAAHSTKATALTFYKEKFFRGFDEAHDKIFRVMDSPAKMKAIAAFRGCGKSTIATHPYMFRKIVFEGKRYVVYVASNADKAQERTEEFKYEITTNPLITDIFGDVRTDHWAKDGYVVNFAGQETFILPRGNWQTVRGSLWRGFRPDCLIVDDLEKAFHIMSDVQRAKTRKYLYEDLLGSVDMSLGQWDLLQIGNVMHQDSLLQRHITSPGWEHVWIPACDAKLNTLVPNTFSTEQIKELYKIYDENEDIEGFYREYMQSPVPLGADASFQRSYFHRYREEQEKVSENNNVINILLIDPARTANIRSADSALVVVGFDPVQNIAYIRDILAERFHMDELFASVEKLCRIYNVRIIGLEVTGLHEFIVHPLRNYLIQNKVFWPEIVECQARGGGANNMSGDENAKVRRSRWLADWYRRGLIKHHEPIATIIESALLSWPYPHKWDVIDALAYLTEVLDKADIFMHPQYEDDAMYSEAEMRSELGDIYDGYSDYDYRPLV